MSITTLIRLCKKVFSALTKIFPSTTVATRMQKIKEIPRNNVYVVDGAKARAVFYHVDPEREAIKRGLHHPYIHIARIQPVGPDRYLLIRVVIGVN